MKETRFYLVRVYVGQNGERESQKLRYSAYAFTFNGIPEGETPTFYNTEADATAIANSLNLIYRLSNVSSFVDVYKEEVKVTKVTDNDPVANNQVDGGVEHGTNQ
ncbi:TPA: hypothetical protein OXJ23_000995 [Staphylococcus aureus]|nr:hypothetical protein [Staphylococcus aureus]HCW3604936.1 hypothetical protein [Staphylococcus aureus]